MWSIVAAGLFIVFVLTLVSGAEEVSLGVLSLLVFGIMINMKNQFELLSTRFSLLEKKYETLEEQTKISVPTQEEIDIPREPIDTNITQEELIQAFEEDHVSDKELETTSNPQVDTLSYFEMKKSNMQKETSPDKRIRLKETKTQEVLPFDKAIASFIAYMKKGNPLVKIGGALLFFGLSFLIKFAAEQDMVSIEMGIISAIVFSFVLIGLGWKHREREGSYGLILQGVGISIFYLSIFSSAKYFEIIPFSLALALMIIAVVFASFLAVAQNSLYLALFATTGGFLSPILTSTGEGSHVVLFSYYAILNLGIISIAWFKSWRILNLTGFAFTFIISLAWGFKSYAPEHLYTTEPFLIFFFLLYVAVSVIFAFKTKYKLKGYVDSSLLFGVPVTAFAMQASLVKDIEYALSFSALAVSAFYLGLAWWLKKKEDMSVLSESFLALAVVFITLAVPFALEGHWTAVTWTLEATAIIWISLRQERAYAKYFAVALQVIAGLTFLNETFFIHSDTLLLNNTFFGGIIISIAALLSSYIFEKYEDTSKNKQHHLSLVFLIIGLAWWLFSWDKEIFTHLRETAYASSFILMSLFALGFFVIAKKTNFIALEKSLFFFFPLGILALFNFHEIFIYLHPFANYGYISLPVFFATHYFLLYKSSWTQKHYWHEIALWLILLLLSLELFYQVHLYSKTLAIATSPLLAILSIFVFSKPRNFWPLNTFFEKYHNLGLSGVFVYLVLINIFLFSQDGTIIGFAYIPLLNQLDIMQLASFLALLYWMRTLKTGLLAQKKSIYIFIGSFTIIMLSIVLARSVHFYAGVPYFIESMLGNGIFQAGISIIYSLLALVLIIIAKQKVHREIWIVGASLLGFVTLKLFFVELSHTGTLSRIVSFMAVGILILLIGYLAPLPPKKEEKA